MLINFQRSAFWLLLVEFVLTNGIVALVTFAVMLPMANYDLWLAAAKGVNLLIFIGLSVGLGSILIYLGLRLKAQGDSFEEYGLTLGLGILIFVGLTCMICFMHVFSNALD